MYHISRKTILGLLSLYFLFNGLSYAQEESLYEGALEQRIFELEQVVAETNKIAKKEKSALFYGSFRLGYTSSKINDSKNKHDIQSQSSRIGVIGSHDISSGLKGSFRGEWGLGNNGEIDGGVRIGYVGIAGNFGQLRVGQDWTPFYNLVGEKIDNFTYTSPQAYLGAARLSNMVQYTNQLAGLQVAVMTQIDSASASNTIDRWQIATGGSIGMFNVGFAYDIVNAVSEADKKTTTGISVSFDPIDNLYLAFAYYNVDTGTTNSDQSAYDLVSSLGVSSMLGQGGSLLVGYGQTSNDAINDITTYALGVRKQYDDYRLYVNYQNQDTDNGKIGDQETLLIGGRYDF